MPKRSKPRSAPPVPSRFARQLDVIPLRLIWLLA